MARAAHRAAAVPFFGPPGPRVPLKCTTAPPARLKRIQAGLFRSGWVYDEGMATRQSAPLPYSATRQQARVSLALMRAQREALDIAISALELIARGEGDADAEDAQSRFGARGPRLRICPAETECDRRRNPNAA